MQNPKKFNPHFKTVQLFLGLCIASFAYATNVVDFEDENVRRDYDLFRIEGVYEVETVYTNTEGQRDGRIDRLVIYRNADPESFTISLAYSKFNTTFFLFKKGQVKVEGDWLKATAKGEVGNGVFAKIDIDFNRETLELSGKFRDSIVNGYKTFKGKPLYNLSMCLYQPEKPAAQTDELNVQPQTLFEFPTIQELLKVYKEENGKDLLILQSIDSETLSLVKKKILSDNEFINVSYESGVYYQKYGVIAFNWAEPSSNGKVSVTYRKDENGEYYLKVLSISSGGQRSIRKFYPYEEILEEELPPPALVDN